MPAASTLPTPVMPASAGAMTAANAAPEMDATLFSSRVTAYLTMDNAASLRTGDKLQSSASTKLQAAPTSVIMLGATPQEETQALSISTADASGDGATPVAPVDLTGNQPPSPEETAETSDVSDAAAVYADLSVTMPSAQPLTPPVIGDPEAIKVTDNGPTPSAIIEAQSQTAETATASAASTPVVGQEQTAAMPAAVSFTSSLASPVADQTSSVVPSNDVALKTLIPDAVTRSFPDETQQFAASSPDAQTMAVHNSDNAVPPAPAVSLKAPAVQKTVSSSSSFNTASSPTGSGEADDATVTAAQVAAQIDGDKAGTRISVQASSRPATDVRVQAATSIQLILASTENSQETNAVDQSTPSSLRDAAQTTTVTPQNTETASGRTLPGEAVRLLDADVDAKSLAASDDKAVLQTSRSGVQPISLADAADPTSLIPNVDTTRQTSADAANETSLPGQVDSRTAALLQATTTEHETGLSNLSRATVETTAHLAAQINRRLEGRSTRFDMVLTPEDLGRVEVRVEIDSDGQLAARLAFDNPAAAADLRGRADELRRQLQDAGFQVAGDALDFSQRDTSSGDGFERQQRHNALSGGGSHLSVEADASPIPTPDSWNALSQTPDRVDLKV